jgi:hypothetical protein
MLIRVTYKGGVDRSMDHYVNRSAVVCIGKLHDGVLWEKQCKWESEFEHVYVK